MNAERELPKYKCHKEVRALKIKQVDEYAEGEVGGSDTDPAGGVLRFEDSNYPGISVDQAYMEKHNPQIGGYYVVYADGYKSFSPAEAFETGYSLIE